MNALNKTIVICGVTGGVGRALAIRFGHLKWRVIGLARNADKLQKLSELIGDNFTYYKTDIKNEKNVATVFKAINSNFHNIDILVNSAAVFKMEKFEKCSFKDIDTLIDTNLKGLMYVTLTAIKIMKKYNEPNRIVNIGSVASIRGIENQAIYCASKFGLNGFSEALNQEVIKDNISITTLFPGGIVTPLWSENNPYPAGSTENLL